MHWTVVRFNDGFQASLVSDKKEVVRCVSWSATSSDSALFDLPARPLTPDPGPGRGKYTSRSTSSGTGSTSSGEEEAMETMTPKDIEDYLNEFHSVLTDTVHHEEEDTSDDPGEFEAEWLREAGFHNFVDWAKDIEPESLADEASVELDGPQTDKDYEAMLATYTFSQQQTVRKRLKIYQTTVRKKKAKSKFPDVRDVFPSSEDLTDVDVRGRSRSCEEDRAGVRATCLRPQSSVVDDRLVLKASPEERSFMTEAAERPKKGPGWADRAFMRSGNKHSKRVSSDYLAGGDSGGVEVLSYSCRSSIKRQPTPSDRNGGPVTLKPPVLPRLLSSEDEEDDQQQDLGFEVLDQSSFANDILPEARVLATPLGVTSASDLGKDDNKKMRSLALIELTAIFDANGLSYSRRKAARKKLKDGVFGSSLLSLLEDDRRRYPNCIVPVFLDKMLRQLEHRGLNEEGLLRIAGSRQKVETLKALVDNNWRSSPLTVDSALTNASVHDIVSLLKNFIRELPEPLLTYKYMDAFLRAMDLRSIVDQLKTINLAILVLPETHRETLKRLTSFMVSVASASARNRMSTQNIAVIMAPNLFPPKGSLKKDTVLTHEVAGAAKSASVTRILVHYHHCLWIVPPSLLRQVRDQNEEMALNKIHKGAKPHHRRSRKLSTNHERTVTVDIHGGSEVHTLSLSVDGNSCARDILDAASGSNRKDRFSVSLERLDLLDSLHLDKELFETGGNIGEHRLDPVVRISAILRENPDARFVVRPVSH